MLTSWSEQSTPPELSTKSVLMRPPFNAYSMRPRCEKPRLPPSPTTLQRSSAPFTRNASLARSPMSRCVSSVAFTYVPMPPFHSKSTGMHNTARINSGGVKVSRFTPSIACASRDRRMDFSVRA